MFLDRFYNLNGNQFSFTRQQASDFAKQIAGDFNPIHDIEAKRFCVPGDLLFSVILTRLGLYRKMSFTFSCMVGEDTLLTISSSSSSEYSVVDDKQKEYLRIQHCCDCTNDEELIQQIIKIYVEFSGKTFPHIILPLMAKHGVMINIDRPLVIYESMMIDLDRLDFSRPELVFSDSILRVQGKRGEICLSFNFVESGKQIGKGEKRMVLSGLKSYQEEKMQQLIDLYHTRKQTFQSRFSNSRI